MCLQSKGNRRLVWIDKINLSCDQYKERTGLPKKHVFVPKSIQLLPLLPSPPKIAQ